MEYFICIVLAILYLLLGVIFLGFYEFALGKPRVNPPITKIDGFKREIISFLSWIFWPILFLKLIVIAIKEK